MTWMNDLLDRAQRIANMAPASDETTREWNALEDHILGKLYAYQCEQLRDFALAVPCQGSCVLLAMLPRDIVERA